MYQHLVFALAAASMAVARPSGEFVSILTGTPRAIHDLPVGRTPVSRADMQEMARLAIAVNTAYCPVDRQLQPHPTGEAARTGRHVRSDSHRHTSSVIISSRDPEFEHQANDIDMSWYISHTPATQTLTLAFSSLPSTDDLLDLLSSSPENSTSWEDNLIDLPEYLFPAEYLPFAPSPRIHHSYLPALESHGTSALLALLDLIETPPVPISSSGNVLQNFIDSMSGTAKAEKSTPIQRVEIVGHGLGSSMGLLVALALHLEVSGPASAAYETPLPEVDIVATLFGLPRVGDDTFATWVDELQLQYDNFRVNRVISYTDTITHLPERHLDLVHPSIGEIWIGADPRIAYACRSEFEGEESEDCAASIPLQKTSLLDHAGPFAGIWIAPGKCRKAESQLISA